MWRAGAMLGARLWWEAGRSEGKISVAIFYLTILSADFVNGSTTCERFPAHGYVAKPAPEGPTAQAGAPIF
jgi:hypothetical protein